MRGCVGRAVTHSAHCRPKLSEPPAYLPGESCPKTRWGPCAGHGPALGLAAFTCHLSWLLQGESQSISESVQSLATHPSNPLRSICSVGKWKWKEGREGVAGGKGPWSVPSRPRPLLLSSPPAPWLVSWGSSPACAASSGFLTIFLFTMKVWFSGIKSHRI